MDFMFKASFTYGHFKTFNYVGVAFRAEKAVIYKGKVH